MKKSSTAANVDFNHYFNQQSKGAKTLKNNKEELKIKKKTKKKPKLPTFKNEQLISNSNDLVM